MDLFTYLLGKKGQNTHKDLFSYLLGKKASGGSGTYTTFSGTSLNISNTIKAAIKKFMLNSTELTQDGTPTPDNPVDVNVITGSNNIKIQNKNFFNKNNIVYINNKILNDSGVEISDITGGYTKMYIQIKANTEYTISGLSNIGGKRIYYFDENKMFISRSTSYSQVSTITFTTPSNAKYIDIQYYINGNDFNNWQIEQGSSATDYIEHQEQNYPITLSSKNLFNPSYYLNQTFLTSVYKYTLSDVVGNRTLYFKGKLKEGKEKINGLYVSLTTSGGDPNQGTSCYAIRGGNLSSSQYITADFTGINDLYLSFYPATYRWEQINEVYDFWIATEDIEYSPYIANPIEYCKIGDYADQIFKNTKDSEFYDSTLLENEWYLKKNIGKYVFTGNENITIQTTTATKRNFIVSAVNDTIYQTTNVNEIPNVRTTKFVAVKPSASWTAGKMSTGTNTKSIYLITEPTVEIVDLRTIIANEPLYYALATPQYIHISETDYPILRSQLDNLYNNAKSYDGQTNITQTNDDLPFNISVDVKVANL